MYTNAFSIDSVATPHHNIFTSFRCKTCIWMDRKYVHLVLFTLYSFQKNSLLTEILKLFSNFNCILQLHFAMYITSFILQMHFGHWTIFHHWTNDTHLVEYPTYSCSYFTYRSLINKLCYLHTKNTQKCMFQKSAAYLHNSRNC